MFSVLGRSSDAWTTSRSAPSGPVVLSVFLVPACLHVPCEVSMADHLPSECSLTNTMLGVQCLNIRCQYVFELSLIMSRYGF